MEAVSTTKCAKGKTHYIHYSYHEMWSYMIMNAFFTSQYNQQYEKDFQQMSYH